MPQNWSSTLERDLKLLKLSQTTDTSYRELAEAYGMSAIAFRYALRRAKDHLRKEAKRDPHQPPA